MLQRAKRIPVKEKRESPAETEERVKHKPPPPEGTKAYEQAKRAEAEKTARLRALRLAKEAETRGSS
jgi:hypothetical protein